MEDPKDDQNHKPEPTNMAANAGDSSPSIVRPGVGETERPASAQRVPEDVLEPGEGEDQDEAEDCDPAEKIEEFDWDALHAQYHEAINTASAEEAELINEWTQLMEFFKIWAEAGHQHESDRTFHRLRTRMDYVNNSEQKLEKTRQHYIEVVRAFESALALLRNTGFGG